MKSKYVALVLIILLLISAGTVDAQCPMCKKAVESGLKEGSNVAKGLNTGILYLLSLPYLAVATVGFIWWKKHKQARDSN